MKKKNVIVIVSIIIVVLGITALVLGRMMLLSGKKIKCKSILKEDNYSIVTNYVLYENKEGVYKMMISKEISSKNTSILDYYTSTFESDFISDQKTYGGYEVTKDFKKNKSTINVLIDFNKMNLKKYLTDNKFMDDYINKKTIDIEGVYKMFDINEKMC